MTSNEIRASFLKYFERHGHRIVPSSPLVPGDDPTLLFTNAGMNQFKDAFLGREKRSYTRATTSQKCMRVSGKHNDLDNVGPSLRHHTFFEMLGNFSFGDYFKADAIAFAWELLTGAWTMPADRLVVSIFKGEHGIPRDEEAYDLWRRYVPADRILELGLEDNFWQMGDTGPCGRCSEIYFVRGTGSDPEIEIWNNVFMEFERSADGTLNPLPAPSIDTGMGLERITAVLQQKESNYDTDLFQPLLQAIAGMTAGHTYNGSMSTADVSMRVVADHIRATTFLIADGVIPSNEWRGYVLRKIMRRAMRHGKHLGLDEPFLHRLVGVLDREMGDAYPELRANRGTVEKTILAEENRFETVLREGLPRLEAELTKVVGTKSKVLSGEAAFRLYDTFGVPFDFIEDTAVTQGVAIDRAGYEQAMEAQRGKARAGSAFGSARTPEEFALGDRETDLLEAGDQFDGYTTTRVGGVPIVALFDEKRQPVDRLAAGGSGFVTLAHTPFYVEAGGQVSDTGRIVDEASGAEAQVDAVTRIRPGLPRAHHVRVAAGELRAREIVTAEVDVETRNATRRNHTATHLLHAALRQVLGAHVRQAGSLVAPDRLRFDFVHFSAVTREQQLDIERIVNEQILKNTPVRTELKSQAEAVAAGAMALFGEKYGDVVRVVAIPGFSMELCGGTHVAATGDIGLFAITGETGIAAGVRRIEAVTGMGALQRYQEQRAAVEGVTGVLNVPVDQAADAVERLQAETKRLHRELQQHKALEGLKGALDSNAVAALNAPRPGRITGEAAITDLMATDLGNAAVEIGTAKLVARELAALDKDTVRGIVDKVRDRIGSGVVVLASRTDEGKVSIVVGVTPDLSKKAPAGQIVKKLAPIVGGGGGGRPDFAEAGGKDPSKIAEMLKSARSVVAEMLNGSK